MKRIILFLILPLFTLSHITAKTTYIPTYYTQVNIVGDNCSIADSTARRELTMMANDGRYAITILHDSVTAERVKDIKNMKAAAGWATALAVVSGVSAMLNPMVTSWDVVSYMTDLDLFASSTMLNIAAEEGAVSLQRVSVTIRIENLSGREMVVNDMKRGLTWFVPAHNYIQLNVGNPEVNKLRIAYADCQEQKKDYLTIQAANYLKKRTIAFEDDDTWIYPVYDEYVDEATETGETSSTATLDHYEQVNKVSFEHKVYSISEFKEFKKANKK